jgi:Tol biopolymer transport system component
MNESMDRALADWLREGPEQGPREGLERALAATRRTSQRPGWSFPERWLPMQLTMQRMPAMRPAFYLALIALLAVALLVALLFVGSQRRLPPPYGPAGNGLVAYDADGSIYVAQSDGSQARRIEGGLGYDVSPSFSRDGTRLAFWSLPYRGAAEARLFVADGNGSSPARQVTPDARQTGWLGAAPAWSPDGREIYFVGVTTVPRLTYPEGLVAAATDGSAVRRVGDAHPSSPATVSPDGSWLAYRNDDSGQSVLTVIGPDGTGARPLVDASAGSDAFQSVWWSADGQRLVYHREGRVEVVGLDGSITPISRPGEVASYPSWSPDGRLIAYDTEDDSGHEIVVANADGTGHRDLGRGGCMMHWSPDSTYLFGYTSDCFSAHLTRIPVDDPSAAIVFDLPGAIEGVSAWQRVAR